MSSRILPEFELLIPQSIPEALDVLDRYRDNVTVLAGGTDVMVALKSKFRTPYVMSLAEIPGLDYVRYDPSQGLRIGAKATITALLRAPAVKQNYRALWDAASVFATPQIRNSATVLGNLLRASPAGDCSCAVYALGGKVVLKGTDGDRDVGIDDFWIAYNVTARKPSEIAVELQLPAPGHGTRSAFMRLTRTNEDLSKLNVAVRLDMAGNVCKEARLAMGCVGPTLVRLKKTEARLKGVELSDQVLQQVAETVLLEINPIDDIRSTAEYRRQVAGIFVKRAIQAAVAQA